MTTALRDRKRRDLKRRLSALKHELNEWRDRSSPGSDLRKHRSQIERLSARLNAFSAALEAKLDASDPLEAGQALELAGLELHRIWEFFRSKLAQRAVPWYRGYLAAADELAWACYFPVRDVVIHYGPVAREALIEPPLVFFNGAASPLSMSRDVQFAAEPIPSGRPISTDEFKAMLSKLPVPVIGIPWFQIAHLPDALLTGHEVAHQIEDNLGLKASIGAAMDKGLASVEASRASAWRVWRGEVFADLYGVLATGPAFVDALIRAIAASPKEIAEETRPPSNLGRYPTKMLRALFTFRALEHLTFNDEAKELREEWQSVYGKQHALPEFEPDIELIVAALVDAPHPALGGGSLEAVFCFRKDNQITAVQSADGILQRIPPVTHDVREIFAAAGLAYRKNPAVYSEIDADGRVLEKIQKLQDDRVRAHEGPEVDLNEADKRGGRELFDHVWQRITASS